MDDKNLNLTEIAGETQTAPAAEQVVAPVTTAEQKTQRKPRKKSEPAKKPSAEKVVEPTQPALAVVSLNQFLDANKAKLLGRVRLNLNIPTVPAGKYEIFVSDAKQDADMFLISDANKLVLEAINPDSIRIETSGAIISNSTRRVYVMRNGTMQFDLDANGIPTSCRSIRKVASNGQVVYSDESKEAKTHTLDEIKVQVKVVTPPIVSKIEQMTDAKDVLAAIKEFMAQVQDINYLIKIEKQLLMECF
jgi:hypothetical protein